MTLLVALLLGSVLALLQVSVVSLVFLDPLAAPLLTLAAVAGWGAARDPVEPLPMLLAAAAVVGLVSSERIGWFLLASLPTAYVLVAARRADGALEASVGRRLALGAVAGGLGASMHGAVLALAGGHASLLAEGVEAIALCSVLTALLAAMAVLLAWPLRPKRRGLFS